MSPTLVQMIDIAIKFLSQRALAFLSLLLTAGGFAWCLFSPDTLRIVSATIFGVLCLFYQSKNEAKKGDSDD